MALLHHMLAIIQFRKTAHTILILKPQLLETMTPWKYRDSGGEEITVSLTVYFLLVLRGKMYKVQVKWRIDILVYVTLWIYANSCVTSFLQYNIFYLILYRFYLYIPK